MLEGGDDKDVAIFRQRQTIASLRESLREMVAVAKGGIVDPTREAWDAIHRAEKILNY